MMNPWIIAAVTAAALILSNTVSFSLMRRDKLLAKAGQRRIPEKTLFLSAALFGGLGGVLGILERDPVAFLQSGTPVAEGGLSAEAIEAMIVARKEARASKNFAESDRIRKELEEAGVLLEDGPQGTTWRRK